MHFDFIAFVSRPDVFAGIIVFLAGCAFLAVSLLIVLLRNSGNQELENRFKLEKLIEAFQSATTHTGSQVDSLRRDILTITSEMNNTQSTHFTNFLNIINGNADTQNNTLSRMQEALLKQLQSQTETSDKRLESLTTSVSTTVSEMNKTVRAELDSIRNNNNKALDGMRETIEEKLHAAITERVTESFKTVESQLRALHQGLGEMREMQQNVDGLRRVLTNVKTRGTFGEVQLSMILKDILTPAQYAENISTRPHSTERVEFAIRLPGPDDQGQVWLPIDAKFPMEDYERLMLASEKADAQMQDESLKALQARILFEAKKIHSKYVEVPYTTEFAVMYLPTEGLWSEVIKIPGLVDRVQREFHIAIAGPTILTALLNSLQMGFKTLAIEKQSAEVWKLLGEVKAEFEKFNSVIDSLEKKVEGVRTTVNAVKTRTNVMTRKLKSVEAGDAVLAADSKADWPSLDDHA